MVFLGVAAADAPSISRLGYRSRRRPYICAATSRETAIRAYRRRHAGAVACFRVEVPFTIRQETTADGVLIKTNTLNADRLEQVDAELAASYVGGHEQAVPETLYVAVRAQDLHVILQEGYQPRSRSCVPVKRSVEAARIALSGKLRTSVTDPELAVLSILCGEVVQYGCRILPYKDGFEILPPDAAIPRLPPAVFAVPADGNFNVPAQNHMGPNVSMNPQDPAAASTVTAEVASSTTVADVPVLTVHEAQDDDTQRDVPAVVAQADVPAADAVPHSQDEATTADVSVPAVPQTLDDASDLVPAALQVPDDATGLDVLVPAVSQVDDDATAAGYVPASATPQALDDATAAGVSVGTDLQVHEDYLYSPGGAVPAVPQAQDDVTATAVVVPASPEAQEDTTAAYVPGPAVPQPGRDATAAYTSLSAMTQVQDDSPPAHANLSMPAQSVVLPSVNMNPQDPTGAGTLPVWPEWWSTTAPMAPVPEAPHFVPADVSVPAVSQAEVNATAGYAAFHAALQAHDGTTAADAPALAEPRVQDDAAEFPMISEGSPIMVQLKHGVGADEKYQRWTEAVVIQGGMSRESVQVAATLPGLGGRQQLFLNDRLVKTFLHPRTTEPKVLRELRLAEVANMHNCLKEDGSLEEMPGFSGDVSIPGYKLSSTNYRRIAKVISGELPEQSTAAFWKDLDAHLKPFGKVTAAPSSSKDAKALRCFAAFECESCAGWMGHLTVSRTYCQPTDPRIGEYHEWDEWLSRPVYKKWGDQLYIYAVSGCDLRVNGEEFDLLDYTRCRTHIYKKRGDDIYVHYRWYDLVQKGRWFLSRGVVECSASENPLFNPDVCAYSDSSSWEPFFEVFRSLRGETVEMIPDRVVWAFGRQPGASDTLDELPSTSKRNELPHQGWHGVEVWLPWGRRFVSCWTMTDMSKMNLYDKKKPPTKGCLKCHEQAPAFFVEAYDAGNPEHVSTGSHKFRECLECFRNGTWCKALQTEGCQFVGKKAPAWTKGRRFRATEAGLQTELPFKGARLALTLVPEVFAIEDSVWRLGQAALERDNNKGLFDCAFRLQIDRPMTDEPETVAECFTLLNHMLSPNVESMWEITEPAAVQAVTSAQIYQAVSRRIEECENANTDHVTHKNLMADVLLSNMGMDAPPEVISPEGFSGGWLRFGLSRDALPGEWRKCFHGTAMTAMSSILLRGLTPPSNSTVAHGQRGSSSKKTIYTSKSLHYAAHPVYSPMHQLKHPNLSHDVIQMVLECQVKENGFTSQNGTLGSKHWSPKIRIDPDLDSLQGLEYLVENPEDVQIAAVLFRKFGRHVDATKYGELPTRLNIYPFDKVEFRWTTLVQKTFKENGLLLTR
eukprot:TRINITY_DN100925_c0_g1_i1.p1 TRINITY_DN100925_c0_g1~~TRINITY_DN100925_c0_g1_i1.p1  ORF type:complete len:1358 (+),score=162.17 TRINITY_DN100925_c0_g1_i1:34-4074(+)